MRKTTTDTERYKNDLQTNHMRIGFVLNKTKSFLAEDKEKFMQETFLEIMSELINTFNIKRILILFEIISKTLFIIIFLKNNISDLDVILLKVKIVYLFSLLLFL